MSNIVSLVAPQDYVELPEFGTASFNRMQDDAIAKAVEKFAWVAQCMGVVLRRNPLAGPAYKDFVFNRIERADYGFNYIKGGKRKFWYPDLETIFGEAVDNDGDETKGIIVAEKVGFLPNRPEVAHDEDGCRVLNIWRAPPWIIDLNTSAPDAFIEHVMYLTGDDQSATNHLLDSFAHLVQRPEERPAHALLITSEAKGIGKSTLGTILQGLVGRLNSRVVQTKDLKGQFDGWLIGKLLIQVDEVYEAGNWDLANKLKPLITEPRVSVNIKYGPQLETQNFARFVFFSNNPAPISIEQGDRRYFVINSPAQPRSTEYYERLNSYISSHQGMTEIYSYLMRRDLTGFKAFAPPPLTRAKEAVINVSRNSLYDYIEEAVQSGHFEQQFGERTFTYDQMMRQLQTDGFGHHARNSRELSEALKLAGVVKVRTSHNGQKVRGYELPKIARKRSSSEF